MTLVMVEQILLQFCFLTLSIATLLSWVRMAFYEPIPSFERGDVSVFWTVNKSNSKTKYLNLGTKITFVLAHIGLTALLILRWIRSGHIPLSNLYESSMCLAWSLMCFNMILQRRLLHSDVKQTATEYQKVTRWQTENRSVVEDQQEWFLAIIAPSALLAYGFATLGLPKEMQQSSALVPALQSNWLMMHVSMMMLSYGALLCGSLFAVTLLVVGYKKTQIHEQELLSTLSKHQALPLKRVETQTQYSTLELECFYGRQATLASQLDYWSYRTIGIGFPLLTVGILSGAVWANEAWGAYWSWDPKEVWALITWLVFAVYLHARMSKGWYGTKPAWIASFGLAVVWICYLGVNLLGKGLHSYGWFR